MTSRERIEAALSHREPDRTPIFEYVLLPPLAELIIGKKYIDYMDNIKEWNKHVSDVGLEYALRQYVSNRLILADRLGHDMLFVVPNPIDDDLKFQHELDMSDFHSKDPVERVKRRNIKKKQQIELFNENKFLVYFYLLEEMERRGMDLPVKAPAYTHGIWTDIDLMQTMLLEPDIAHEHFKIATASAWTLIEKYLEIGIMQIGVGGDFSGNKPMISPESYRSFIVPQLKIITNKIHTAGGWAINGSDGNLWPSIDDFLVNSGVDGYIEIDMRAGMDLKKLKENFGNRITFYGNMDCGEILSFGTPEKIKSYTMDCIENGWGNGGHIFTASNAITESVPLENYISMVNTYRKIFGIQSLKIG